MSSEGDRRHVRALEANLREERAIRSLHDLDTSVAPLIAKEGDIRSVQVAHQHLAGEKRRRTRPGRRGRDPLAHAGAWVLDAPGRVPGGGEGGGGGGDGVVGSFVFVEVVNDGDSGDGLGLGLGLAGLGFGGSDSGDFVEVSGRDGGHRVLGWSLDLHLSGGLLH